MTETRLYGSDKQFPVFHDVCNRNRDRESLAPPPAPPPDDLYFYRKRGAIRVINYRYRTV